MREIQKGKLILDHQITINTLTFFKLSMLYPMKISEEVKCQGTRTSEKAEEGECPKESKQK